MSQTPVTCPKQPLSRDLDVEVFISRPQTELATDMTMIALLTPDVAFSDGGNDRVRFYNTLEALTGDVAVNSAAYWAGQAFFARSERPSMMCVGQVFTKPTAAVLRGGAVTISQLRGVTNGGFDLDVSGKVVRVRDLNFSSVTNIAQVATVVSGKLAGVQCFADSSAQGLVLKTNVVGDGAEISYASGPSKLSYQVSMLENLDDTDVMAAVTGVTDGSIAVMFNGRQTAVAGLDFSSATTLQEVAGVIQAALRGAGLTGLQVFAGTNTIIFRMEGPTSLGFAACVETPVGTNLAAPLKLMAVDTPYINNFVEAATAVPASLTSGTGFDYTAIAALGTADLKLAGQTFSVDFSGVTDEASLLSALTDSTSLATAYSAALFGGSVKLTGTATTFVTYAEDDAVGQALKMTRATATAIQQVSVPAYVPVAATDVSSLLALTEALASSNVIGYTPGNLVSEAMLVSTAARCAGHPVYGWILDARYRETQDQKAFADWCESRDPSIFVACTNSPQAYNSADVSNIGAYCYLKGYKRTGVIYHNNPQVYPDMSYLACALSVNYAQQDSAITLKFKQLDGIEPSPLTNSQLMVLQSRNINSYVFIGNTAREVREGTQALDTWFTDSLVNLDNFKEEVQVEVYNVFLRTKKVPYTAAGQNMLVSAAAKICARYTRNAVFADRDVETTSNETGFETLPATNIQPAPVTGATASDRARRLAPPIAITAYEAGAFHKVTLNVSVFN